MAVIRTLGQRFYCTDLYSVVTAGGDENIKREVYCTDLYSVVTAGGNENIAWEV